MSQATYAGINTKYAVKSDRITQKYPALQATTYQPRSLDEEIEFCFSEASYSLLETEELFNTKIVKCAYKRDSVLMHQIISPVRWIFLNAPRIFLQDKKTKEITYPEKGVKLAGTDKVTIAKCFLACLNGDRLILNEKRLPQIFTLKLTSNKTKLIGYLNNQSETKTILSLNNSLQQHFKTQDNLLHLVSVDLIVRPQEFVSSHSGESSLGIEFAMKGDARVLSAEYQKQIFELISNEDIKDVLDDPFGLRKDRSHDAASRNLTEDSDIDF